MQHKGKNRHGGDVAVSAATRLMNDQPAITAITQKPQGSIRAEFVGSNKCVALGLLAKGYSPGLELCRRLVAAGYDPALPLHIYRGEMHCLTVRSIGVGAQFTVEDDRYGRPRLRRWRDRPKRDGTASLVARKHDDHPKGRHLGSANGQASAIPSGGLGVGYRPQHASSSSQSGASLPDSGGAKQ